MLKKQAAYSLFFLLVVAHTLIRGQSPGNMIRQQTGPLKKELAAATSDTAKIKLRYQLGYNALLTRTGYWDSLISDAHACKMRRFEGKAFYALGYSYFVKGLKDKSLYYFNKSYQIACETGSKEDIFQPLLGISHVFYMRNDIRKALDNCYAGLKLAEELHDTLNIANFYIETALCYLSTRELNKSKSFNLRALDLYKKLRNEVGIARSLVEIGTDYITLGQKKPAASYYMATKTYANAFEGSLISIEINNSLGSAFIIAQQYDSAYKYSRKSYDDALGTNNTIVIVSTMVNVAAVSFYKGNYPAAKTMAESALRLSKTTGFTLQIPELTNLLKRIYIHDNDYKKVLEMYELAENAKDSLSNAAHKKEALEKEFNYSLQKKESENKFLAQQNKIQSLELLSLSALIALVLIIAWQITRQNKFNNEQKSMLLEQKLLRLQMNPHFIFNSLQAIQGFIINRDEKEAVRYLTSFATVTRHVLENSRMDYITLDKEIALLKSYLHLQKLRFGARFDYTITAGNDIDTSQVKIPPMLSQPFIENAVEHGMYDVASGGLIEITYLLNNNTFIMEISDNGHGIKNSYPNSKQHRSLAIEITQERIALMNQQKKTKASFTIAEAFPREKERKGVKVTFHFPFDRM